MPIDPDALLDDFGAAASTAGVDGWPCEIQTETVRAPHKPPALRSGHGAVYVFALSDQYAVTTPAGLDTVLKVGLVGPNSAPRFTYMHYSTTAARSTLAKSLVSYRIMWPWLGIDEIDSTSVKEWMLTRLDRLHFFVPAGHKTVLSSLEVYVRARVGSVFEGAAANSAEALAE